MAAVYMKLSMGRGIRMGQAFFGGGCDLQGKLAEGIFIVVGPQPFHGNFRAGGYNRVLIGSVVNSAQKRLGLRIVLPQSQALAKLPGGTSAVAIAIELYGEIETIVSVVGIVGHRPLEVCHGELALTVIENHT